MMVHSNKYTFPRGQMVIFPVYCRRITAQEPLTLSEARFLLSVEEPFWVHYIGFSKEFLSEHLNCTHVPSCVF